MLNPNIEMLENLISAAVSTRYKEVPPTEEVRENRLSKLAAEIKS